MTGTIGRFSIIEVPGDVPGRFEQAGELASTLVRGGAASTAKAWMGFPFREVSDGPPDLRLVGVSALGDDRSLLQEAWQETAGPLDGEARYDVEGEVVKASGTGWGIPVPTDAAAPLQHDEPVLVVISGDLYPQHVGAFVEAAGPVVGQANRDPSYLGGCGLVSASMLDITSFSCWGSARASRRFGYGEGEHRAARDDDEAHGWHDQSTVFFATLRILGAAGTLLGKRPFV